MGQVDDIAKTLHAAGMTLRAIGERLAQLGYLNANGKPYAAQSVANMLAPAEPRAMAPGRPAPAQPPAAPPAPRPALPADATVEERLRHRLADLDALRDEARAEQSYTAAVTAAKGAIALELQIEATRRPAVDVDPTESMTDEEITAGIVAEVAGWSDDVLDAVEEAIAARRGVRAHTAPVLRVVADGS